MDGELLALVEGLTEGHVDDDVKTAAAVLAARGAMPFRAEVRAVEGERIRIRRSGSEADDPKSHRYASTGRRLAAGDWVWGYTYAGQTVVSGRLSKPGDVTVEDVDADVAGLSGVVAGLDAEVEALASSLDWRVRIMPYNWRANGARPSSYVLPGRDSAGLIVFPVGPEANWPGLGTVRTTITSAAYPAYSVQEFHAYGSPEVYVRHGSTDDLWGGWVLLNPPVVPRPTDVIYPVLFNGWARYQPGWSAPCYMRDGDGIVHMWGMIGWGSTAVNTPMFQLAAGYRPQRFHTPVCMSNTGPCRVQIGSDGYVSYIDGGNTWIYFHHNFDTRSA